MSPSSPAEPRLFLAVLGGRAPGCHIELHDALQRHKDDLAAVDDCLALEQLELLEGGRWHVQLAPHPEGFSQPQVPDWFGYRRIDRGVA